MSMCPSCQAFPEVLLVQRAGLRGILEGVKGRSPLVPRRPIFFFFFPTPFFSGSTVFFVTIHFAFGVTFALLCPAYLTLCPPHTKFWGSVPHIPTPPPAPPIVPSVTLTHFKTCSTRVTFSSFALS